MSVVSNTSPISYLVLIDFIEVLPALFGRICVPPAVIAELAAGNGPVKTREWALAPPGWLATQVPTTLLQGLQLHAGETEAISLALSLKAERLLIDDRAGREAAQALGLPLVGTIGVLDLAAERGLVDLREAARRLKSTNFRIARPLLDELLERDAKRR